MTFSLDVAIKNIFTSILGGDEDDVGKEQPKSGLMSSSLRPKKRPENLEPVEVTARESVTQAIKDIGNNTTTDDTVGVDTSAVGVNMNEAKLLGKFGTSAHKFIAMNKDRDPTSDKIKVLKVPQDDFVDNYLENLKTELGDRVLRPRARPLSRTERIASYQYSEKDGVKGLQQALNAAGITVNGKKLVEDGIEGNNTIKAIRAFQKEKGLKVDGKAGKNTKAALYSATRKPLEFETEELDDAEIPEQKTQLQLAEELKSSKENNKTDLGDFGVLNLNQQYEDDLALANREEGITQAQQEEAVDEGGLMSKSLRPKARPTDAQLTVAPEIAQEVKNFDPIKKVKALGYIKSQYKNAITNPSKEAVLRIIKDLKDGTYGGYASAFTEKNSQDAKTIEKFFQDAIGSKSATFDATEEAWCALFVDHVLNEMGADRLASGKGDDVYDRVRARAYENYGEGVLGQAPTVKDFNDNSKQGDLLILHSSYKVVRPDGTKKWISFKDVKVNKDGTYSFKGDPSDDIKKAEVEEINKAGYTVTNQYHVGFSMGKSKNGFIQILGGNQNDQVNVRGDAYPVESIMAVRRITPAVVKEETN
jgi:hypothetical protein